MHCHVRLWFETHPLYVAIFTYQTPGKLVQMSFWSPAVIPWNHQILNASELGKSRLAGGVVIFLSLSRVTFQIALRECCKTHSHHHSLARIWQCYVRVDARFQESYRLRSLTFEDYRLPWTVEENCKVPPCRFTESCPKPLSAPRQSKTY